MTPLGEGGHPKTVLVTGYAKAPEGTSMYQVYRHAGVVLEIDPAREKVVDAEFTLVTDLAKRFFREMLIGYDLRQGLGALSEMLSEHYIAPSQQAIIAAVRAALQRYYDQVKRF